jgi:hypothetical protein
MRPLPNGVLGGLRSQPIRARAVTGQKPVLQPFQTCITPAPDAAHEIRLAKSVDYLKPLKI